MEREITNLKINMAELKNDIKYIKSGLEQNSEDHKTIIKKMDDFIVGADEKYVHKESFIVIQKIVYGLVGTILIAFLYAIIEQLLAH